VNRSVICQRCKQLVDIHDRRWSAHEKDGLPCPISNTIYTAPVIHRSGPAQRPGFEIKFESAKCPQCNEDCTAVYVRRVGQIPEAN